MQFDSDSETNRSSLSPCLRQPNPTNKQSIVLILGMLSSLFTTLDVNRQADSFEGASGQAVSSSEGTQNPVGVAGMVPAGLFCGRSVKHLRK